MAQPLLLQRWKLVTFGGQMPTTFWERPALRSLAMLSGTFKAAAFSLVLTFALSSATLAMPSQRRTPAKRGLVRKTLIAAPFAISALVGLNFYQTASELNHGQTYVAAADERVAAYVEQKAQEMEPKFKILSARMTQESKAFKAITEARKGLVNTSGAEAAKATDLFSKALANVVVLKENYPQFKTDTTIQTVFSDLQRLQSGVRVERERVIEAKKAYNLQFADPWTGFVARTMGYQPLETAQAPAMVAPTSPVTFEMPSFE